MKDIFHQISELEGLGEFKQIIKLVEDEVKHENEQKRRFRLEIAQLEAHYNLRNFQLAKKNVENLLTHPNIQNFPSIQGDAHNLLGKIFRIHQRYEEALNHYQIAENAYKTAQNDLGLTKIYINMGNAYIFIERFKDAKKFHKKALDLAKSVENHNLIANCNLNLGSVHYQNGEVEEALNYYKNALSILETINDIPALAAVHLNIAETLFLRKNFSDSAKYSANAVRLYKKQNNVLGRNLALKSFARAEKGAGNYEEAVKSYEELRKVQDHSLNEENLLELGVCYIELKEVNSAEEIFQTIRKTPEFSLQSRGIALNSLAIISGENRNYSISMEYYKELLAILDALPVNDEDSKASTFGNLGFIHLKLNNSEEAFRNLEAALNHFKRKKTWDEAIVLLNNFNSHYTIRKEYEEAVSFILKYSLPIARKGKDKSWISILHSEVAFLKHLIGKSNEGVRHWKKHLSRDSLKKYRPKFITTNDIEESERNYLEQELEVFLKLISE